MVHVSKCPIKEGRGHPSHEFTFNGKKYIYCYGWQNMMTDEPDEICKNCPDHVSHAQDDLDQLLETLKAESEVRNELS